MQDEPRLAAQKPRRIDAQSEIARYAFLGVSRNHRLRVGIAPKVLHLSSRRRPPAIRSEGLARCARVAKGARKSGTDCGRGLSRDVATGHNTPMDNMIIAAVTEALAPLPRL